MPWKHRSKYHSQHYDGPGIAGLNLLVGANPDPPKPVYRVIAFPHLTGDIKFQITRHKTMEEALQKGQELLNLHEKD